MNVNKSLIYKIKILILLINHKKKIKNYKKMNLTLKIFA